MEIEVMDKTVPIDDLILFLEDAMNQIIENAVSQGHELSEEDTISITKSAIIDFYDEFGDDVMEDKTVKPNSLREKSIRKWKERNNAANT